ncbi:MAG: 50S ribosomal protein L30e [Candidatus Micrarchaeota archaeon]
MDLNKAIRMAVDTGDVGFGSRGASKVASTGKTKMIILSNNCPPKTRELIERNAKLSGVSILVYGGSSVELGSLCGKPFPISSLSIIEPGNSNILDAIKGQ